MSYLNLPSVIMEDFSQGVISIWFRFSQDSVDKALLYQSPKERSDAPDILSDTIPLVTFGRKTMAKMYDNVARTFSQDVPGGTLSLTVPNTVEAGEAPCAPSHIGIVAVQPPFQPLLVMNFQTNTRAAVQGLAHQVSNIHWEPSASDPDHFVPYTTVEDISYVRVGQPESFLIGPAFPVAVDQWHHLLLSFDFSTSVDVMAMEEGDGSDTEEQIRSQTIKSYCNLWYAFDDENKNGKENMGYGSTDRPLGWVPQDDNGIIPRNAESAVLAFTPPPPDPSVTGGNENPEYHWEASPLPVNTGPIGLPASAEYVETIYHCEMAEFQMWTGVTLDTSIESNRRAFVDAEGKPVKPEPTEDGDSPAVQLLGKRPDILLHGSSDWIKGFNTGSIGLLIDEFGKGTTLDTGQFTPVAGIEKYKPEPALGETA